MERYGTFESGIMKPAPRSCVIDGAMVTNPQAEHLARLNVERAAKGLPPYLPEVDERPATDAAHYAVPTGWERADDTWRRAYEVREYPPAPPRRWTRLAIETALAQAGMLDAVDAYLAQVTVVGTLTAARAFSRCDYIEEGYPNAERWSAILDGAANALGKTREEIDAFLGAIPTE